MSLTLAQSNQIVEAVLAEGVRRGLKPLTAAVLDGAGQLVAFQRADGSPPLRPAIAIGKASGAFSLGVASRHIGEMALDRPHFIAAVAALAPSGVVPVAGGVIIVDDGGRTLGAVGVSGDTSDNDEICALAAITAAGLKSQS
jgi:uncharacterized protein GlcG (DUF336 family)